MPQHFQRQDLYFENQLGLSAAVNNSFAYGFQTLEIDEKALENWQLIVTRATGRTKSGSLFDFSGGEVVRLDLNSPRHASAREAVMAGEELLLFLAIASERPNNANISNQNELARYEEYEEEIYDLHTGGDERQLVFKKLRASISDSDNQGTEFEYLPIAKLSLSSSAGGDFPGIVRSYIPPSTVGMATQTARHFFDQVESRLSAYLRTLADYLQATGINIGRLAEQEDGATAYRFIQLSGLRGWLVANGQSQLGAHPFTTYRMFCEQIGRLAITDPNLETDGLVSYEAYNHDDAYEALNWAWSRIEGNFVSPGITNVQRLRFLAENMETEQSSNDIVMKCVIPPEYFESDWSLYLGLDFEFGGMTSEDQKQFLKYKLSPKHFNWRLGSNELINQYFQKIQKGVTFRKENIKRKKPGLPRKGEWLYVDINDDEYWNAVKRSGLLCLRIDQKNLKTPQRDLGTEKITVVVDRRTYVYRVSLFAVRNEGH